MNRKKWRMGVIFTLLCMVLLLTPPSLASNDRGEIYPMAGINPQHNFQSNYSAKNNPGNLLSVKKFSVVFAWTSWVMDNRYLYTLQGDLEYNIVKYDITSGKMVWANRNIDFVLIGPPPVALYNDTFYIFLLAGGDYAFYANNYTDIPWSSGSLYAISTKDGHVKWYYPSATILADYYHGKIALRRGYDLYYPLTIGSDGTIYIITGVGINATEEKVFVTMIAVNPNGTTKWIFPLANTTEWLNLYSIFPTGVALDENGNIYALSSRYLYSINKNGTLRWKVSIPFK